MTIALATPSWNGSDCFSSLVSPTSLGRFLEGYWETAALHVPRNNPAYFESLCQLGDFESVLNDGARKARDISLVKSGESATSGEFARGGGLIHRSALCSLLSSGHSIVINNFQNYVKPLKALCVALESATSCNTQTNLYYSPPNTDCFKAHHDTHDVFILQISGKKRWHLFGSRISLPLRGQRLVDVPLEELGDPQATITLEQGDTLYMPRGVIHAAETGNEDSLHLTLGLSPVTWTDLLLEVIANVSAKDAAFRKALPFDLLQTGKKAAVTRGDLDGLLGKLGDACDLDEALDAVRKGILQFSHEGIGPDFEQMRRARCIDETTRFCLTPDLPSWSCESQASSSRLRIAAKTLTVPLPRPDLMMLLSGKELCIADLPDCLSRDDYCALIADLVGEGMLVIVPASPDLE